MSTRALPKTPSERRQEIDDAIQQRSRRIEIDRWHEQRRVERETREVWQ
ncbi:hypothetical protein [Chromohalobacter sp. 296-RDG]|nr:hypothetical protein [Chromohalobacter sp. 296-RDG]